MKKKAGIAAAAAIAAVALLGGCGAAPSQELDEYRAEMDRFYTALERYDTRINAIDESSEDAPAQLLQVLTEMDESYRRMAALSVPDEFAAVGDLPAEAAEHMEQALAEYRAAYADGFDADAAFVADQYYERADKRAHVILTILHGEIPQGDGVSVDTEEALHLEVVPEEE